MDESNEVVQSKNTVGNDQVGRDKITTNNLNFGRSQSNITAMQALLAKFKEERKNNPQLDEFIEELDYYNKPLETDVIGLEQKLIDGNRESFINYATRVKEVYHKKLYKFQFSEVAQRINYHLLALVESYFTTYIYPRICESEDPNVINALIVDTIINPLLDQLDENPLGFSANEINGMMYFLTGNCHIKWSK